ncbi:MAG: glycosyltransferase family 4 protein [Bacteroidota bacterium]
MRIAVNTRLLIKGKMEGIGWYTYETMKRITREHPEHEFIFIFDRPFHEEFIFSDNIIPVVTGPPARHPALWLIWFEWSLPRVFRKYQPDIFISPDGYLSLSASIKSVPVIHDLNFEHHPENLPLLTRIYFKHMFHRFARKAERIATVSAYSKNDIIKTYQANPDIIDITYNGANVRYRPVEDSIKVKTKEKYAAGKEYLIFIGSLNPRKNVARLLQGFEKFKNETGREEKLLLVGSRMFKTSDIKETYSSMTHKDDVIFTGRMEPDELITVLGSARALVFIPLFEGFGIPVVEAMYCGVPVVVSNATSLPEVAGDAAIYADPYQIDSIANGIKKICVDEKLRNELIEKGKDAREKFSWDQTAKSLWYCIEKCL